MVYLYIFILVFIIVISSIFSQFVISNIKFEGFQSDIESKIVLLGDSIFKNNSYVPHEKAIENILYFKTQGNCYCYAVNNSKIYDIYDQLNNIPPDLNNKNTTIYLSAGGNDILDKYVERVNPDLNNMEYLKIIFSAYKKLVKTIKIKMDHCNLVLLDIYYPSSAKYKPYKDLLQKWNTDLYKYAQENGIGILRISNILTHQNDFTLEIEPSEIGGEKIARNIYEYNNKTNTITI
jgi:hypothetical protein